jgi:hypothetical protein
MLMCLADVDITVACASGFLMVCDILHCLVGQLAC